MYERASQPGYVLAGMNDITGRRGIWYRYDKVQQCIEICGGREGDDSYVKFQAGKVVSEEDIKSAEEVFSTGAWMVEEQGEHQSSKSLTPEETSVLLEAILIMQREREQLASQGPLDSRIGALLESSKRKLMK